MPASSRVNRRLSSVGSRRSGTNELDHTADIVVERRNLLSRLFEARRRPEGVDAPGISRLPPGKPGSGAKSVRSKPYPADGLAWSRSSLARPCACRFTSFGLPRRAWTRPPDEPAAPGLWGAVALPASSAARGRVRSRSLREYLPRLLHASFAGTLGFDVDCAARRSTKALSHGRDAPVASRVETGSRETSISNERR